MGFLQKLGLVEETEPVVEETTEQIPSETKTVVAKTEVKQTTPKKSTLSFAPSTTTSSIGGAIVGKVNSDIYDKLSVAIEENNLDGNDFLEFMQSLTKMANLVVDEKTKYNMVFATLTTSSGGMTLDHLIDSISHYINVINNEKSTFKSEMQNASAEMVGEKEKAVETLTKTAQEKADLIQKLTQEIQEINGDINTLKSESEESKVVIAQKEADFDVTVKQLESQILEFKDKIVQHIK
jgi:hypothetical protein